MHSMCMCNMIKQSKPLQTRYDTTYMYDKYYKRTHVYVFLFSVNNACLNFRELYLEGDPVGIPHTWYLSAQRLLTHVLCKPTHFFFLAFIATMSFSLQTSFNSVMKDWADKYHVWGTPTRSPSRSNSR